MLKRILCITLMFVFLLSFSSCTLGGFSLSSYIKSMDKYETIKTVLEKSSVSVELECSLMPSLSTSISVDTTTYYKFDNDGKYEKFITTMKTTVAGIKSPETKIYYSVENPTKIYTYANNKATVTTTSFDEVLEEYKNNFYDSFKEEDIKDFAVTIESDHYLATYTIGKDSFNSYFADFLELVNALAGGDVSGMNANISDVSVVTKIDKKTKFVTSTSFEFNISLTISGFAFICTTSANIELDEINKLSDEDLAEPSWVANAK